MWPTIIAGMIGLAGGFAAGYFFFRSTMESAHERGNLAKKISALPYTLLEFISNPKFNALTADQKVDFVSGFFRKELRNLSGAAYPPAQMALEEFYKEKKLDKVSATPVVRPQTAP